VFFINSILFWVCYYLQEIQIFEKLNEFYRNGYNIILTLAFLGGGITLILGILNMIIFHLLKYFIKNIQMNHFYYYIPLILGVIWVLFMILILNDEA
jgi:hypothetical protein